MNCIPGDLARVLPFPETITAGTVGKIIRVTEIIGHTRSGEPAWAYEGPMIMCKCGCFQLLHGIADSALRPIRGGEGEDETLQWAPVPEKVTA